MYPLESMLRVISQMEGVYVMALLDCCREKFKSEEWRGINSEAPISEDVATLIQAQSINKKNHLNSNYIVTYGCPPSQGVPAKSTIAINYFKFLSEQCTKKNKLLLPGNIGFFVGSDGKCETISKVSS